MQNKARLVIIGAGIVGVSAAYHLAQKGWRDIVVLDQNQLYETGGSTSHAPGLVFQTNSSRLMVEFAKYTVQLLSDLDSPDKRVWYDVGGIEVATTPERLTELHRRRGWATAYGLETHILTPAEVKELIPIINQDKIYAGYYVPSDGDTKAVHGVEKMAAQAAADGAVTFYGDVPVKDIEFETAKDHVKAVITPNGKIETEQVLLCTNIWAPLLGDKVGVPIPLLACEHQYAVTTPLPELAGAKELLEHPILRHQDDAMYYRQHQDAYGIGSYQHEPILVDARKLGRIAMHDFTPEHFEAAWQSTIELLPPIANTQLTTKFNGMFSFSIDGMPIMGESRHVQGFWTACAIWVTHSGGAGKAIAEWLTGGVTDIDMREADVNRFHDHARSRTYIYDRCYKQYDEVYDILHPLDQVAQPRGLRVTPFQARQEALAGYMVESSGWERAQWFGHNEALIEKYEIDTRQGWEARHWSPIQGAEHLATRENVALYDLTPFTKLEVRGPGALDFLNYIAANQIDRPIGQVIYTALLTEAGGIKADLTITRTAPDTFWVLTGGGSGLLDLAWLQKHAPDDGSVHITDLTSQYCALGLWGPKARQVLQTVCEEDVSNEAFGYFTAQAINIGPVPAFALRVSYVGELGWEIYTRTEYGLYLWDMLWNAGQEHGLIAGGLGAFDSLRLEKGYRLWGADIHTEYNPYEAGLAWAVRLKKGDFLGREALLKIKKTGINRKLCCLTLDDPAAVILGKEPILAGGQVLGYVSSAGYGYSVGKFIVYGYLPIEYAVEGRRVEIAYFDQRYPATVTTEPLFDAKGQKVKG